MRLDVEATDIIQEYSIDPELCDIEKQVEQIKSNLNISRIDPVEETQRLNEYGKVISIYDHYKRFAMVRDDFDHDDVSTTVDHESHENSTPSDEEFVTTKHVKKHTNIAYAALIKR